MGLRSCPYLLHWIHESRSAPRAILRLPFTVYIYDAGASDRQRLSAAFLRLGRRWTRILPSHWLLVQEARRKQRGNKGFRRQQGRRPRACARHRRHLRDIRLHSIRHRLLPCADCGAANPQLLRRGSKNSRCHLSPPFSRRNGEISAILPAHLAPRRNGGTNTRLGIDPRRHNGYRRRVPCRPDALSPIPPARSSDICLSRWA